MLRKLGHIDAKGMVLLKGKAACEVRLEQGCKKMGKKQRDVVSCPPPHQRC